MKFLPERDALIGIWYDRYFGNRWPTEIKLDGLQAVQVSSSLDYKICLIFRASPFELKQIWKTQPTFVSSTFESPIIFGCVSTATHEPYTDSVYIEQCYFDYKHKKWIVVLAACNSCIPFDKVLEIKHVMCDLEKEFEMDYSNGTELMVNPSLAIRYDYISSTTGIIERYGQRVILPQISDIFYNDPYTTVKWSDGTVTTVKVTDGERFDKEFGLGMAIAKKYGEAYERNNPRGAFRKLVKGGTDISEVVKARRARKEAKKKLRESEKKD